MKKTKLFLDKIPNSYKTFAWSLFYQALTAVVSYSIANLADLQLSPFYAIIAGLALQGLSKWLLTRKQ